MYGCHVSILKTLALTYQNAIQAGCTAFQIFLGGNVTFKRRKIDEADITKVKDLRLDQKSRLFIHSPYVFSLINNFERTMPALRVELGLVSHFSKSAVVIHSGSYKTLSSLSEGIRTAAANIRQTFETATNPMGDLLLENTAGQGKLLPEKLEDVAEIIRLAGGDARLGFCFDTCHGFGSGLVDLRSPEAIDAFYEQVKKQLGLERLRLIHLNDSRFGFGSRRDGHALLCTGEIWRNHPEALRYFLQKFKDVPMVAETANWEHDLSTIEKILISGYSTESVKQTLKAAGAPTVSQKMCAALGQMAGEFVSQFGADLAAAGDLAKLVAENQEKYGFLAKHLEELKDSYESMEIGEADAKETEEKAGRTGRKRISAEDKAKDSDSDYTPARRAKSDN